jgi:hypothetical protein
MMRSYAVALGCLLVQASLAEAQTEYYRLPILFDVSGGYSHLYIGSPSFEPVNKDGGYVDLDVATRVPNLNFPLLLGGGASISGYWRTDHVAATDFSGFNFDARLDSDLGLYSFEARAAVPLRFGTDQGFFLMPRLGMGLLIEDYAIDHAQNATGGTFFYTDYHTGAAFEIRPAIEAGYFAYNWALGAQVSYMGAWGDFGQLGSSAQELRAGLFFRWSG